MNNLSNFTDYTKGLLQEQGKKYAQAIHSYRLAILQPNQELSDVYYRLAYLLDRKKLYEEACQYFLLMNNLPFKIDNNSNEENSKNEKLLQQYLLEHEMKSEAEWLTFSQKAKSFKCWSIASYAYRELTLRAENFHLEYYRELACSLLQEKKYKEASFAFKEKKKIQSIEGFITNSEQDVYQEYFQRFAVEERIIVYESDDEVSNSVYELYLYLDKDAHFDAYRHVWVVDDKEQFNKKLNGANSVVIKKDSDLYKRYLTKAKYIIANKKLSEYYQRKSQQYLICTEKEAFLDDVTDTMGSEMDYYDVVQEVFFGNGTVTWSGARREDFLSKFYGVAIEEFNNKEWKSSHQKFLEIKKQATDVKYQLATEYYIYESKFQMEIKKKSVDELLIYEQYRLSSKNFAGVEYLLNEASKKSLDNEQQWQDLREAFVEILEDIKRNSTQNIRAIKDEKFLIKIEKLSKIFDNSLEAELISYKAWFLLSHLFIFARLYQKYELAREKALFSVLSKSGKSKQHIRAMVETADSAGYTALKKEKQQFLGATELYFNRANSAIDFYKKNYTDDEKQFAEYIKGKSIAIVGPLTSTLNLGEEIDAHDVVVRFNYRGLDERLKATHGSKTNLSFYILEILVKDRIDARQIEFMNQLDWVVADMWHKKEHTCFSGLKSNLRLRYADAKDDANPYFKGTTNGIQRVFLDLLRFETGKIKIYNTNLFLENSYEKAYKSRGSLGADHFNFIWHDPLSNFIFLKRLNEFGIVDADEVLSKILKLSLKEYIIELEKRYGQ